MHAQQREVLAFHRAMGATVNLRPTQLDDETMNLRLRLIREEASEVHLAATKGDLAEMAGELVDLLYVTYGAAVALGVDLEPLWDAIHAANMAKVFPAPKLRADGKLLKPEGWKPADVKALVAAQVRG